MARRLDTREAGFDADFDAFLAQGREEAADVDMAVSGILAEVMHRGDDALFHYTEKFDRLRLTPETAAIPAEQVDAARDQCSAEDLDAIAVAAARLRAFHEAQVPADSDWTDDEGVRLGQRWTAIQSVGLYVPGGTAAYPSTVLMNAIPARVAGVERLVMTVPAPDGHVSPLVLAAAREAGVDEIYRVGGAQAIGALAYGTETIRPVDKIVGPGNAYVAAAKKLVFGTVGIDIIAGPSEILVVADGDNDPAWVAADLMSQAEHDEAARAVLITDDTTFAHRVETAVNELLTWLPRADIAAASWDANGAILLVSDITDEAPALVDRVAPEHLELCVANPDTLLGRIRNAGAAFLGRHTPEAVGDYVGGPNHVLPTGGSARFSSGLSVLDFCKRTTYVGCQPDGIGRIGPAAERLARAEGLDAHALSVQRRLAGESG